MSIQQSGNPGSDKPTTKDSVVEHTPEERLQHEANKMARKGEETLKHSESNNLFTK